jgi:uncharacterized protein
MFGPLATDSAATVEAVRDVVMVICKEPLAGLVKTRMCPPFSPEQAAELALAALADTFAACEAVGVDRLVAVIDGAAGEWIPGDWDVVHQRGGGLDQRLAAAFGDVLQPTDRGVLVAMDTPQATPGQIQGALQALRSHDAVIGMTEDGGFWIIGLNAPRADAFVGVPMSTNGTGLAQRARLQSLGLSVATIDVLRDLDTVDDVRAVAGDHPHLLVAQWFSGLHPNGSSLAGFWSEASPA